jgi:hypothetical protein
MKKKKQEHCKKIPVELLGAKRSSTSLFSIIKVCRLKNLQKETHGASLSAKKVK